MNEKVLELIGLLLILIFGIASVRYFAPKETTRGRRKRRSVDPEDMERFCCAIAEGNLRVIKRYLNKGFPLEQADSSGKTPLIHALETAIMSWSSSC